MSTSDRTFNQVKAILGKLDRAVDEARNKRTTPVPPPPPAAAPAPTSPANLANTVIGAPPPSMTTPVGTPENTNRPNSQFGRAQPLRPQNNSPTQRWGMYGS